MLESELTRLRPLLLMQPLISRSSVPPPTPNPKTRHARRRKKDAAATEDEDHGASDDEPPLDPFDTPAPTPQSQATPKVKSRKSEAPNNAHPVTNPHKRRTSHKTTSRGLSADARVEHLLIAARKIGKHRAGIMSGMVQQLGDQERERRREESATTAVANTPKTPKRIMSHAYPLESGYVYLNGQMRPGPGMQPVPMFIPAYPHHLLQTPSSSTTAPSVASSAQQSTQKAKQDAKTNNPPTPLDSLLSAARTMMREDIDDEDEEIDVVGDSPGNAAGTLHARPKDMGSPIPKRRKVAPRTDKLTALHERTSRTTDNASASSATATASGATNAGAGRVRSALDVLADQAAAFSTQEQPTTLLQSQPQMQTKGKGKGKERAADSETQEPSSSTAKLRGRTRSKRKEPEVDTPSSVAPPSRSRTPQSDIGDNPASSSYIVRPQAGGSASEAPVDPSGGTNSASTSHTLDPASASEWNQVAENNDAQSPDASLHVGDSDATPRQGSRTHTLSEEESDGTRATIAQLNLAQLLVSSMPQEDRRESSPLVQQTEATPSGSDNAGGSNSEHTTSTAPTKNKELARVAEQDAPAPAPPAKRQRSPYVKWSKEEDDLLAQVHRHIASGLRKRC